MQFKAKPAIYISYAWGSESENIADEIELAFEQGGLPIIRDKKHLGYKGRIKDFMRQIGRARYVILVISEKYLHSINCMFELVQIFKNQQFYERIFPVVLDEVNIADPSERVKLLRYWENETETLSNEIKQLKDLSNIQGLTDDLNLNAEIRDNIARLTDILKDTNTLSVNQLMESDFEPLFQAVGKKVHEDLEQESKVVDNQNTVNYSGGNPDNIFVRIKAKLFGTTAFFEVANKNRRRVISIGITAIIGVCAVLLAFPFLMRDASPPKESPVESATEPAVVAGDTTLKEKINQQGVTQETPVSADIDEDESKPDIRYMVELIVPSNMAQADVFVDDRPAEVVERGPISITVRLRKKDGSHHFEIKDGSQACETDRLIEEDNLRLTLCN